ncbi:MAG: SET domain-containing protein-lysine N-methyltransferase [Candidatus Lindowbacteria bacterium]|nr:SET domain-containing protein-lysine N-methyltransferase [Candidatus Lindowbacteria bacterium]
MPKPTTSPYIEVRNSDIEGKGIFAKHFIPKGAEIIKYTGPRITKKQADKLCDEDPDGHVFIFKFDKKHDIDGSVLWNTARYINHTCDPNCESIHHGDAIWITAARNIDKGEELSYDYGFDQDEYINYPCLCGKPNCLGYIIDSDIVEDVLGTTYLKKIQKKLLRLSKKGKI